jgi:indoleamine 2,3-dioxygenase
LDLEHLVSVQEQRRAHSVLVFLAHGYLYGVTTSDQPIDILPKSIAIPLYHLSKMLKIHPVVSYSSVGLWNWKLLDEHGPLDLTYKII